jgi:hypothetical protein
MYLKLMWREDMDGVIWFRIESSDGFLWIRQWSFEVFTAYKVIYRCLCSCQSEALVTPLLGQRWIWGGGRFLRNCGHYLRNYTGSWRVLRKFREPRGVYASNCHDIAWNFLPVIFVSGLYSLPETSLRVCQHQVAKQAVEWSVGSH